MPKLLETALALSAEPGTNLKGDAAGANWAYLLPSQELDQVVSLGVPSASSLATLSRLGSSLTVASGNLERLERVYEECQFGNVGTVLVKEEAALPFPGNSIDLVFIATKDIRRQFSNNIDYQYELLRILKLEGAMYYETSKTLSFLPIGVVEQSLIRRFGGSALIWLAPVRGELQAAVPAQEPETIEFFVHNGLTSTSVDLRALKRLRWFPGQRKVNVPVNGNAEKTPAISTNAARSPLLTSLRTAGRKTQETLEQAEKLLIRQKNVANRYGVFLGRSTTDLTHHPPRYLRAIAQGAGIDISHSIWGLSAPGNYNSRKVLFFLFNRHQESGGSQRLEHIVKTVRDPSLNARLENEHRALKFLHERGIGTRKTIPEVIFFGYHSQLAVVGETVVEGEPFRDRTWTTVECPFARAVIDWLIYLGEATVDYTSATARQVADGLDTLFSRFSKIYRLSLSQNEYLTRQIAVVRNSLDPFPLLLQHGDLGPWNILVTPDEEIGVLDWEAAEIKGMPLWDLFYFMRSFGLDIARAHGTQDHHDGLDLLFLTDSPVNLLFTKSTERYCHQIGLKRELIVPLFYTCWMHRALKEASRLAHNRVETGRYIHLLRLCLEERNSSKIDSLFNQSAAN